jgi:hypothetical protein
MTEAPAAARMAILVTGATGYIGSGVAGHWSAAVTR